MNYKIFTHTFLIASIMGGSLQACRANDAIAEAQPPQTSGVIPVKASPQTSSVQAAYAASYLMGQFNPATEKDFVKIPTKYADRSGLYLRKEALGAFIQMRNAARKDGVYLKIRSATRNFDYQKGIWEKKWRGKRLLSDGTNIARDIKNPIEKSLKILEYSSMPGTSRHHWGTDIDLNSFDNKWFQHGKGLKLFKWMNAHAAQYGFKRPYTAKGSQRPHGYNEEKWHWSYTPLSVPMTQAAQKVLHDQQIQGFLGSETAVQIGVVKKYILGVDASCR